MDGRQIRLAALAICVAYWLAVIWGWIHFFPPT